ncbi:unnamed protein product [Clonostachys byssicola]|uniref:Mfs allantoate protein n=1 Tax=Clonostachys byssicola TaxID=160290 RepID=A0A9N9U441_9HYPO|nr:unnamed protein product [Clonostachys byssicola]
MNAQPSECQALELSRAEKCHNEATHAEGLFCWFHSKQVYGLYLGYKRRNARLDALDDDAPEYLKSSTVPLANQTFQDLDDEKALQEVHAHLFEKYNLLGRVIDARRLHHKHFYSLKVDYGHQAYLDKLSSQRHTVLRALEKLDRRIAKLLYEKEQWFAWARQAQDEEEENRDKEQKKIKQEAALFKRHWAVVQARLKSKRQKEEKKRHEAYLEAAYQERKAMDSAGEDGDEEWDPIEDEDLDKRNQYVDLIKHFLWMEVLEQDQSASNIEPVTTGNLEDSALGKEVSTPAKKPKKKSKKGDPSKTASDSSSFKAVHGPESGQKTLLAMQASGPVVIGEEKREPDKGSIETEVDMRKRLKEGVEKDHSHSWGTQLVGSLENPHATFDRTAAMTDEDIDSTVEEVKEIKLLLFCRLVLAHASLLPAALRASNVEEFLQDAEITESDLRDICLKVEAPTLQNIRDACADFARGDELEDDPGENIEDEEETEDFQDLLNGDKRYQHLHSKDWLLEHIMDGQNRIDEAGKTKSKKRRDKKKSKKAKDLTNKKTKITICGKTIWNHASEKAMSRDGWLQFSIIAKDCDLKHAIQLCRNWSEFSDLNLLALWQFFPASNWVAWTPNQMVEHLQKLEFFPYFIDTNAQQHSRYYQVGGRGQARRQHDIIEARNIIVGHMKRNDPVTRRFLQYMIMRTGEVLVLVRDGKTGRVITAPPDEHLWTYRRKSGIGRASKNEWFNILEVGPQFFALNDKYREWRFGFDDYYDVYIWDFVPCQTVSSLSNTIIYELRNAWRLTNPREIYSHMEPLLSSLTREETTMRTRKIKPGEDVRTLWDIVNSDSSEFIMYQVNESDKKVVTKKGAELAKCSYLFYNEGNVLEDAILFPDELQANHKSVPFREIKNPIDRIETGIMNPDMRGWAKVMDVITSDFPSTTMHAHEEEDKIEQWIWEWPEIWESGLDALCSNTYPKEMEEVLMRTRVTEIGSLELHEHYETSSKVEVIERERSIADEPMPNDLSAPWPHSFIVNDIVRAFATMAMFFPELEVTTLVTKFIRSDQCESFRNSLLFNPRERGKTQPDRRTRTSQKLRDSKFWDEWNKVWDAEGYYTENIPLEWNIAIRPIIAKLYRAGVITPTYAENDRLIILGVATANTEPHRPGKLDLFINYHNPYCEFVPGLPPNYTPPDRWPVLLPLAQKFASKHEGARFALLRLWSAPHFYPLMVGPNNRSNTTFLDGVGRPWEFRFVPKDMLATESMIHTIVQTRLKFIHKQVGDQVAHRGDLILVMAEDSKQLFKYATAVTFALQTRPWIREVDLWKSFVNVELDVLEGLDPYWWD